MAYAPTSQAKVEGRGARPEILPGAVVPERQSARARHRESVWATQLPENAVSLSEGTMVREVKLRQVGGSVGATLPKDMAERLNLAVGDRVLAVETAQGILLSPYDPTVEKALVLAAKTAKKYRNALRQLAK